MQDSQGDLLPYASPETALAHCRRLERRILNIATELSKPQLLGLLGELALADRLMDALEAEVLNSVEYRARQRLNRPVIPFAQAERAAPDWPQRWIKAKRRRLAAKQAQVDASASARSSPGSTSSS